MTMFASNYRDLVNEASLKGWKYLWVSQIRKRVLSDSEFADAVRMAERWGIEVRGQFTYCEWQAIERYTR